MKKRNPKFVVGALGWDMGCAITVVHIQKSPFGYIYFLAVSNGNMQEKAWLEMGTEKEVAKLLGPDCCGKLPGKEYFKNMSYSIKKVLRENKK